MGKAIRKNISPKKFASAMLRGGTIEESAIIAGYSQSVARRGKAGISKKCLDAYRTALEEKARELQRIGSAIGPNEQESLVRGRLVRNVVEGKDEATQSARLLGNDKRIAMFNADAPTGIFVIQLPAHHAAMIRPGGFRCSDQGNTVLDRSPSSTALPEAGESK